MSEPTGGASFLRIACTPAITVVLTAPRPTNKMPSLPLPGAIFTEDFTARDYIRLRDRGLGLRHQVSQRREAASQYHQQMLFRFRRMRAMDPLQVAMTGVRMGERYLQVFCSDATLTRGLATKTGLSGTAALAAPDDAQAARARRAASKAGVLIDVKVTPPATLPWEEASFDMVVIDETGGGFSSLGRSERTATLQAALRPSSPRRTGRDHRAAWTRPARRRAGRAG